MDRSSKDNKIKLQAPFYKKFSCLRHMCRVHLKQWKNASREEKTNKDTACTNGQAAKGISTRKSDELSKVDTCTKEITRIGIHQYQKFGTP